MSNIKKLLKGVEVEWKPLAYSDYGVAELSRGRVMSKEYLADNAGEYPVYSSQTANNGEIGKIRTFDHDGESVTWTTDGANAGTVFHRTGRFSITNVCGLIRIRDTKELNYKFLFYWLSIEAKKYVYSGMGNPKLMSNQIAKIPIPIPPLEIQQEIVRILDKFSSLTAELQAELQARKFQYEYYRNQLLTYPMEESDQPSLRSSRSATSIQSSDNPMQPLSISNPHTDNSVLQPRDKVKWNVLEEVVEIKRGKRLVKTQLEKTGKYAVYQNCMIPLGYYHKSNAIADTTFIISAGSAGEIGYSSVDFWAADDVYYFVIKNDLKSRFLYYFLLTQQQKIYSQVRRSSVPRLSKTALEKLLIPIPSLEEQERIVSILDKFDTLTTSITEGLPKEIELRQKQYEYYRDMLLTFPTDNIKA